ncbi:TPA: hypothetical protein ACUNCG_000419 [Aeromonas hydrophila]
MTNNDKSLEYIVDFRDNSLMNDLLPNELLMEHMILIDPEDSLLSYYKEAAILSAEKLMNRPIFKSKIILSANSYVFRLPYGGYRINSMVDDNGKTVEFKLNRVTKKVKITSSDVVFPVQADVDCDFGANGDDQVPATIIHGLLMSVATMFQNRESIVLGISANDIPYNHRAIFMQYRLSSNPGGV